MRDTTERDDEIRAAITRAVTENAKVLELLARGPECDESCGHGTPAGGR